MARPLFRLPARLGFDAVMALLFISSLAFRITGRMPHEAIGLALCLLFCVHTAINRSWYTHILKGAYPPRRALGAVVNAALIAAMPVLCVTGILNSRHIFGFSQCFDGESIRQIHSFAAYWGLVLIGVHTGLHGEMILGTMQKVLGINAERKNAALTLRGLAGFLAAYGVWASFDRDMGAKLFQGFAFDFWSPDRPTVAFFTNNLAILGVCAVAAHYVLKGVNAAARKDRADPEQLRSFL